MNPKLTPAANIGDVITVIGYADRLFKVDAYSHEFIYESDAEYEEIYYDCTCVTNSEPIIAAQEDIYVMAQSKDATEYLKEYKHPQIADISPFNLFVEIFKEVEEPTKLTPFRKGIIKDKQQRIDELLDERLVVGSFLFEDEGNIDQYKERRYAEIDEAIRKIQAQ